LSSNVPLSDESFFPPDPSRGSKAVVQSDGERRERQPNENDEP